MHSVPVIIEHCDLQSAATKGYPLWEPDCHPKVSIADVGYIRRGRFCRLFNASLPPGHPLNEFGEPDGYEQLNLDERAMVERRFPPGPMVSHSVTKRGADVDISGLVFVCLSLIQMTYRSLWVVVELFCKQVLSAM
jgi:hypothetical protein